MTEMSKSRQYSRAPSRTGSMLGHPDDSDRMGYFVTVEGGPEKKLQRRRSIINITTAYLKRLESNASTSPEVVEIYPDSRPPVGSGPQSKFQRPDHLHSRPTRRMPTSTRGLAPHESLLAQSVCLEPGMNVLSLGCVCTGSANNIARFAKCNVIGLNNNQEQVAQAQKQVVKTGAKGGLRIRVGHYLDLPYADNTFDAVYACEGKLREPSLTALYDEVYRVLKPGALFGLYEWVMTDSFAPDNPQHQQLRQTIEKGNGISNLQTRSATLGAFKAAGFSVVCEEDHLKSDTSNSWLDTLGAESQHVKGLKDWIRVARTSSPGRVAVKGAYRGLEMAGVAPKGTAKSVKEQMENRDRMVEAVKSGLFTPMYLMVGRKRI